MKKIIWGNTIVKNEDVYIWFAIKSVIESLDKIIIWDTGSTDYTVEIIKLLQQEYPEKILFKEIGPVDAKGLTQARERMLEQTNADWVILLDGDEVWWKKSIQETVNLINHKGESLYAIVTPVINLVGDIYHYQDESAGQYEILGRKGHFNIRAINRKIPGLHIKNEYPLEGFYDKDGVLVQDSGDKKVVFCAYPLMHFTHLPRSSFQENNSQVMMRRKKYKYEIGKRFPVDFKYPEAFYESHTSAVLSPWKKMSKKYFLRASIETIGKKIKRKFFKNVEVNNS